jgi:hypothetical protein
MPHETSGDRFGDGNSLCFRGALLATPLVKERKGLIVCWPQTPVREAPAPPLQVGRAHHSFDREPAGSDEVRNPYVRQPLLRWGFRGLSRLLDKSGPDALETEVYLNV